MADTSTKYKWYGSQHIPKTTTTNIIIFTTWRIRYKIY